MPYRTFQEIVALVQSRERESLTLDYKVSITDDLERTKKELAKDVSAFANSQGGAIILGVAEQKGIPIEPIQGVPSLIDSRQKTTDWLDQTLNQNISQRVNVTIRPFELPDDQERCVIVIEIPPSPRAPHMVTYQQDNRYYRRYFKRHQFESLVAAEYEVREMFMRSLRYRDEVEALLTRRRYFDRFDEQFSVNDLTRRLIDMGEQGRANSFVAIVAVPSVLDNNTIQAPSDALRAWIDQRRRTYGLPFQSRSTLDGLLLYTPFASDGSSPFWREFLFIGRNGLIEYGTAAGFGRKDAEGIGTFHLVWLMGRYWAFLSIVREIYQLFQIAGSLRLLCNITDAQRLSLRGFGAGWADGPRHELFPSPQLPLDQHLQVIQSRDDVDFDDASIEALVRALDQRIEQAFGYDGLPRSFNHPNLSDGSFAGKRHVSMQ